VRSKRSEYLRQQWPLRRLRRLSALPGGHDLRPFDVRGIDVHACADMQWCRSLRDSTFVDVRALLVLGLGSLREQLHVQ
jgi:hypothetical protein